MSILQTMLKRRSVRSYTGEKITDEELEKILAAANASPCAMGRYEKFHMTVINNKAFLDELDAAAADFLGKTHGSVLYGAPTLVLISAEKNEKMRENSIHSTAAMMAHNMALEAAELGVGACCIWGAVAVMVNTPALLGKLELPENFVPCCSVILGKTDEKYEVRDIDPKRIPVGHMD